MNISQALDLINVNIRGLKEYHLKPEHCETKLNQNENPFDWPEHVKDDVAAFCRKRHWNRYPTFIPAELKKALAGYAGVLPENVIAGNGSNEMLLTTLISLSEHGRPVILCQPTFTMYEILIRGLGRTPQVVTLDKELRYDIDAILEASARAPDSLMILCSPNNPTGSALTEADIRAVLKHHRGFLLLDQAYVEFGGYSAIPLLKEYPNLLITRTFSKACRGAGIRLGYMLGAAEIISQVNKIKLPYNVNFFSEHVAMVILSHRKDIEETVEFIKKQRQKVYEFLTTQPLENVYQSCANFILIRTKHKDALFAFLRENGILVRDVSSYPMLENCVRISIGSGEENDLLMQTMALFYKNRGC